MRETNITVIGLGKLGLCNALCLENAGYNIVGVDVSEQYVKSINDKTLSSYEPYVNEYLQNSKNLFATISLLEGLEYSNVIFIVVQTPNGGENNFYDHSILSNLLQKIDSLQPKNKHFVICCTVMPEYINTIGKHLLSNCDGCTLNYNPEFIAQGDIIRGYHNPDIILIGEENKIAGDIIEEICVSVCKNEPRVCRMTPVEAEITKISINGFITTKIAYANMIGDACKKVGADPDIVTRAIGGDSRIGNKYFNYGYSFGGPCFPRDTKALSEFLDKSSIMNDLCISVTRQNESHIHTQFMEYFSDREDQVTTFTDVCYKANSKVPIVEESAKLKIAKLLVKSGRRVIIRDEKHIIDEVRKEYGNIFAYEIIES